MRTVAARDLGRLGLAVVAAIPLLSGSASAQSAQSAQNAKKPAPAMVELDDRAAAPKSGPITDAAARGRVLYQSEKYWDAAEVLYLVSTGATGDADDTREVAQFDLAKTFYKLKFFQAAYALFSEIADHPAHARYEETLLWLAKLATDLPEPADIVERVGRYDADRIARFDNAEQRDLFWRLNYLLGRYDYRNGQYAEAMGLFQKVDPRSALYVRAQFFLGVSNVQARRSMPAVQAFQRIVDAVDAEDAPVEDGARMRDLAYLSMARTFYSASIGLDDRGSAPRVDQRRLSAAVKYWNRVGAGGEYWLDALFEESWAYFMAGDTSRALGNIHTIESPYFAHADYPEAQVLRAVIYFTSCRYDDAIAIADALRDKYGPMREALSRELDDLDRRPDPLLAFYELARDGRAPQAPDRQLLRSLDYVRQLDEESKRFEQSPARFRSSRVADSIKDAVRDARELAIHGAGDLARRRSERALSDLDEQLRNGQNVVIESVAARAQMAHAAPRPETVPRSRGVQADDEHIVWPFNGEYWRDELGFYRQPIASQCAR
jgi:hypothetical protein